MTCSDARQLMGRYVADRLSTPDAERLESHLCSCSACEAELGDLLGALPDGTLEVFPPVDLREEILAAIIDQPASMPDECYILAPQLSAFADGELDPEDHAIVERHIASCNACARQHRSLGHLHELVQSLPAFEPSSRLAARIFASIPAPVRPSVWRRAADVLHWRPIRLGLPVAATAALALMATVPFWRPVEPGVTRIPPAVTGPVVEPGRNMPGSLPGDEKLGHSLRGR